MINNINNIFRLGHHIMINNGIQNCAIEAEKNGANVFQIFINSPKSFKTTTNKKALRLLKDDAIKRDIQILVHGNFMLNFCNPENSSICTNAKRVLIDELNDSVTLGAIGVVIHMGKNVKKLDITNEEATDNYIKGLEYCLKNSDKNSILILETGAGQGTEICTDITELGKLRERLPDYKHRIKFCIDTCHIFSAGYNIGDPEYVNFFDTFIQNNLGWKNVVAIHYNDSKCILNCRKDRHADIGKGEIELEGLIKFAKLCKQKNIPIILETPAEIHNDKEFSYSEQIIMIKKLINDS